jgi:hypothetical protein
MFINHRAKYIILLQASGGFTINLSLETFVGVSHIQGPSIQKKNGMHNSKIHTIYKQTSVFVLVFSMLLFWFYYQSRNNIRQFIYDLSMLCLGLSRMN